MNATGYRKLLLPVLDHIEQQLVPEPAHGRRQGGVLSYLRGSIYWDFFLWVRFTVSNLCSGLDPAPGTGSRQVMDQPRFCRSPTPEQHLFQQSPTSWRTGGSLISLPTPPSSVTFCYIPRVVTERMYVFFSSCAQYQFRNKMKFSFI